MTEQQPTPVKNGRPLIQRAVIDDLQERLNHGIEVYGTGLQVGNGRDMIQDAYEEAMDLTVYLKGMRMVREELIKILTHLADMHRELNNAGVCVTCVSDIDTSVTYPCHQRVDIETALSLLGHKI